ncbi:hypothetical protein MRX96_005323 [Rhipicephalus microplus]
MPCPRRSSSSSKSSVRRSGVSLTVGVTRISDLRGQVRGTTQSYQGARRKLFTGARGMQKRGAPCIYARSAALVNAGPANAITAHWGGIRNDMVNTGVSFLGGRGFLDCVETADKRTQGASHSAAFASPPPPSWQL